MDDFGGTPYAIHGAFALAKFAVEAGDLARAGEALRWVVAHGDDPALAHIARLRLAQVLLADDAAAQAISVLQVNDRAGFAARYHELSGDAHLQAGDKTAARTAYESALEALEDAAGARRIVQLKLDNLGE